MVGLHQLHRRRQREQQRRNRFELVTPSRQRHTVLGSKAAEIQGWLLK
jgi:hypothetical protein